MLRLKAGFVLLARLWWVVGGGKASVLKSFQQKPRAEGGLVGSTQVVQQKVERTGTRKAGSTFHVSGRLQDREVCMCYNTCIWGFTGGRACDLWRDGWKGRAVELGRVY
jgi:hypothetical protein